MNEDLNQDFELVNGSCLSVTLSISDCLISQFEATEFRYWSSNDQVIPAFEEAVSGMALGGIRRCTAFPMFRPLLC